MARPAKSTAPSLTLATMINFFVTGSLAEVRAAVETGKAILASRSGTNGTAAAPAPRKRVRTPKQPALPGTTAATAAPAAGTGPVAVPGNGAAKRGPGRPRGPRAARPAVTGAADAAPAIAGVGDVPGAIVEAATAAPLPEQGVPGEE